MGILVGSLETMSRIDIRRLYGRSSHIALIGTPCIKQWWGPIKPGFYVIDRRWLVGSATPVCPSARKKLYSKLENRRNKKGRCVGSHGEIKG